MSNFVNIDKRQWTYLRELVMKNNSTTLKSASYRITTAINKPRHVFTFIINDASNNSFTAHKLLYYTFNVDDQEMARSYLEVGNGNEYPRVHYKPKDEQSRLFRDVMQYVHANNEYDNDTLLNRINFNGIFSFIYFDLTNQPMDIKDGLTQLIFHYELSDTTANGYTVYALILHEQNVEIGNTDGKLLLRSM